MNATITAHTLSVALGGRKVLRSVDLTVREGEFVSILGRNGAGKSTLLRALAGLCPYQEGEIIVAGQNLTSLKRRELATLVSFLPQKMSLVYPMLVRDFILMGRYPFLRPFGGYTKKDRIEVTSMIERLHLESLSERYLHELSGGEQQRVLIAGALVQEARFLILDEPAAFLDPVQREALYILLKNIQEREGVAVVLASHDIQMSTKFSDVIISLTEGAVSYEGDPKGFCTPSTIKAVYGKELEV